ncbi:hypothetical protein SteCoe_35529 [Stentor coeruleus]|uniref:Protein RFT1 homolog n=1 Tax=Stentor coeruleus TaxID=5963 RepID=A0A1R2AS72_9CILI|nr:hypothetical protein SteCoe_35529 [Stentor coeruleus]
MSLLAKGFKATKLLISFHLVLKVINFGLGIVVASFMDPEAYRSGQAHLTLATAIILNLSKEIFRKIAFRSKESPYGATWVLVGVTWVIALATYAYSPKYTTFIICIAAMIEVLCEPFHITHLIDLEVKSTIVAESFSTISNFTVLILLHKEGILAFCYGHLAASITNFIIYMLTCTHWPSGFKVIFEDKALAWTWVTVGFFKFFISEGEKLFLTYMAYSAENKGILSLVVTLCAIVPKMLFQPIEEITHILFTKNLSKEEREEGLVKVYRVTWLIGLTFIIYSQIYAQMAISILYGNKWEGTEAASGLALYSFYVLFMGIFGISDAILCGIAPSQMIARKRYSMTMCFIAYVAAAYVLTPAGSFGLILASMISMMCKLRYIFKGLFGILPWLTLWHILPTQNTFISYFVSFTILKFASFVIYDYSLIAFGGVVLLVQLYFLYKENASSLQYIKSMKKDN